MAEQDESAKFHELMSDPDVQKYFEIRDTNPDKATKFWFTLPREIQRKVNEAISMGLSSGAMYPGVKIEPPPAPANRANREAESEDKNEEKVLTIDTIGNLLNQVPNSSGRFDMESSAHGLQKPKKTNVTDKPIGDSLRSLLNLPNHQVTWRVEDKSIKVFLHTEGQEPELVRVISAASAESAEVSAQVRAASSGRREQPETIPEQNIPTPLERTEKWGQEPPTAEEDTQPHEVVREAAAETEESVPQQELPIEEIGAHEFLVDNDVSNDQEEIDKAVDLILDNLPKDHEVVISFIVNGVSDRGETTRDFMRTKNGRVSAIHRSKNEAREYLKKYLIREQQKASEFSHIQGEAVAYSDGTYILGIYRKQKASDRAWLFPDKELRIHFEEITPVEKTKEVYGVHELHEEGSIAKFKKLIGFPKHPHGVQFIQADGSSNLLSPQDAIAYLNNLLEYRGLTVTLSASESADDFALEIIQTKKKGFIRRKDEVTGSWFLTLHVDEQTWQEHLEEEELSTAESLKGMKVFLDLIAKDLRDEAQRRYDENLDNGQLDEYRQIIKDCKRELRRAKDHTELELRKYQERLEAAETSLAQLESSTEAPKMSDLLIEAYRAKRKIALNKKQRASMSDSEYFGEIWNLSEEQIASLQPGDRARIRTRLSGERGGGILQEAFAMTIRHELMSEWSENLEDSRAKLLEELWTESKTLHGVFRDPEGDWRVDKRQFPSKDFIRLIQPDLGSLLSVGISDEELKVIREHWDEIPELRQIQIRKIRHLLDGVATEESDKLRKAAKSVLDKRLKEIVDHINPRLEAYSKLKDDRDPRRKQFALHISRLGRRITVEQLSNPHSALTREIVYQQLQADDKDRLQAYFFDDQRLDSEHPDPDYMSIFSLIEASKEKSSFEEVFEDDIITAADDVEDTLKDKEIDDVIHLPWAKFRVLDKARKIAKERRKPELVSLSAAVTEFQNRLNVMLSENGIRQEIKKDETLQILKRVLDAYLDELQDFDASISAAETTISNARLGEISLKNPETELEQWVSELVIVANDNRLFAETEAAAKKSPQPKGGKQVSTIFGRFKPAEEVSAKEKQSSQPERRVNQGSEDLASRIWNEVAAQFPNGIYSASDIDKSVRDLEAKYPRNKREIFDALLAQGATGDVKDRVQQLYPNFKP